MSRRRRLRRRRGPGRRRRARRHRRAPRAGPQPADAAAPAPAAAARWRTPATPAAPPTCSASRSTSGTWPSEFHDDVIDDFVAEYAAGRTPNPCLRCNEKIKFAAVLDRALALGFDAVVTGHHARLGRRPAAPLGRPGQGPVVRAGRAAPATSSPTRSSRSATRPRPQVRAEAAARGLAVADKPDSHDICFIADGDTRGFLAGRLGEAPGEIVDAVSGEVLGTHDGAFALHRRPAPGAAPGAAGPGRRPRYVLSITPVTNTVTVGPVEALEVSQWRVTVRCGPAGLSPVDRWSVRCSCARTVNRCRPWSS